MEGKGFVMTKVTYHECKGTILFLGFGAVAQCTLPLVLKHIQCDLKKIIIVDPIRSASIAQYEAHGIRFIQEAITAENLASVLKKLVHPGDLIIDLAVDIDCCAIVQWCHDNDVLYINTSVELWDPYHDIAQTIPTQRTLYPRHMKLRALKNSWQRPGPTAVVEHGANPGLVSHFTKKALVDIAHATLKKSDARNKKIEQLLENNHYPHLAQLLGVKTIHISERDTQIASVPRAVNEFVNTWSIDGFYEEGIAPSEIGWGTHEKELPAHAYEYTSGPKNQICLAQMGIQTWARSIVPSGPIIGMIVRHGESFTISDHLTVWDAPESLRRPLYRPTVHYVYCPTDAALNSLHELKMRNLVMQENKRIMRDEIISGVDEVGVLLMGHDFKSWWTGSVLSIDQTRAAVPGQNATTLQVACSVLAAVMWMLKNPTRGVCVPDDLPYEDILAIATPYLGDVISQPIDWTPLDNRRDYFKAFNAAECCDYDDPWQFKNFCITTL